MRDYFSIPCPVCGARLNFLRVKPKFACPNCHTSLSSNFRTANLLLGIFYLIAAPFVWLLLSSLRGHSANLGSYRHISYSDWVDFTFLASLVFYVAIYPRLLKVEREREGDQTE